MEYLRFIDRLGRLGKAFTEHLFLRQFSGKRNAPASLAAHTEGFQL
jgi:hypothetical protein